MLDILDQIACFFASEINANGFKKSQRNKDAKHLTKPMIVIPDFLGVDHISVLDSEDLLAGSIKHPEELQ
ncbi:MAG: hypothetical protein K0Q51_525 [Rickettsiaceae bacterium]|jgi:hypothetical protein|nr:hypothetical protein [Rickettsiaceae bacterium]